MTFEITKDTITEKDLRKTRYQLDKYHMSAYSFLSILAKNIGYDEIVFDSNESLLFYYIYPICYAFDPACDTIPTKHCIYVNEYVFDIMIKKDENERLLKKLKNDKNFFNIFVLTSLFVYKKDGHTLKTPSKKLTNNIVLLDETDSFESILMKHDLDSIVLCTKSKILI